MIRYHTLTFLCKIQIIELIIETIEQPFPEDHYIGQAIVYECIESLAVILNPELDENYKKIMRRIMRYLSMLLQSNHGNNVYIGLCALETLIQGHECNILPIFTDNDRDFVFQCLDQDDDSIQRKAFSLLSVLATQTSVQDICERIIFHIKSVLPILI